MTTCACCRSRSRSRPRRGHDDCARQTSRRNESRASNISARTRYCGAAALDGGQPFDRSGGCSARRSTREQRVLAGRQADGVLIGRHALWRLQTPHGNALMAALMTADGKRLLLCNSCRQQTALFIADQRPISISNRAQAAALSAAANRRLAGAARLSTTVTPRAACAFSCVP